MSPTAEQRPILVVGGGPDPRDDAPHDGPLVRGRSIPQAYLLADVRVDGELPEGELSIFLARDADIPVEELWLVRPDGYVAYVGNYDGMRVGRALARSAVERRSSHVTRVSTMLGA